MCGIIGFSGSFSHEALELGLHAIIHRGPDDTGIFFDQSREIGLGHARLAIIDLSPAGHQPMEIEDGILRIVFNGEIYNYRELQSDLRSKGHTFKSSSDTEVLLKLYLEHGREMLKMLNGIFAFAIYDSRSDELFLARDALGVKPLYVAETDRGVGFSSEIKGLLHLIPECRELDHLALHRYLCCLWCPGDRTPLKAVRKVQPGEYLVIKSGRVHSRTLWYSLPIDSASGKSSQSPEILTRKLRDHLRTAVSRQMISDVPVGAFLSGGLDSSAIVAFARESTPDIQCYTIRQTGGTEDGVTDDLLYAHRVAQYLGVPLHTVEVDSSDMAGDFEQMIRQLDEPLADPAALNVLYISRLAKRHGIKVLLSGAGGDDLFTGYRRHYAVHLQGYLQHLPRTTRHAIEWLGKRLDTRSPVFRRIAKFSDGAALLGNNRLANYFLWGQESQLLSLYSDAVGSQLASGDATRPFIDYLEMLPTGASPIDKMLALEQRFFLADHNLTYTDKMSMAEGIETRVPFLDPDLVNFSAHVPSTMKQRGRVGKWIFKKAMEQHLPEDVIYRPKTGFGAPLRRWMNQELSTLTHDLLGSTSLRQRGIFDPTAVSRLLDANRAGKADGSYTLLAIMAIEIWCRHYIDG